MTTNDQFQILLNIAANLKSEYGRQTERWRGSEFAWILAEVSRTRGKIGEELVEKLSQANGLEVARSPDAEADRLIEGKRVEIKLSTLWKSGVYKFQQIRDQNYDYLLCLGISPAAAHAWIMSKSQIPFDQIAHQHGGQAGRDTWWISVDPDNPPSYLVPFGGTLEHVVQVLKSFQAER